MNNRPIFSVIMACRNSESYVGRAIQSVLSQTFENWELIVVDDASVDGSLELIRNAALADNRIKYIAIPHNSGPAISRNAAVNIATGEWLSILDADDVFLPSKLEKQFEIIKRHNSRLIVIGSGCFHLNSIGKRCGEYKYSSNSRVLKKNLLRMHKFPPHSSIAYLRSAFIKAGGFNPLFSRSQDYELLLRLSEVGDFTSCDVPLLEYQLHSCNISNKLSRDGYSQFEYALAARTCKLLRDYGFIDPSATNDSVLWHDLMTLVSKIAQESNYRKYCDWKNKLKKKLHQSEAMASKLKITISIFTELPAYLPSLVRSCLIGNSLPNKILYYWLKR